jgi:peptidoglycan/LPS O-acetylase OafA/YrhL
MKSTTGRHLEGLDHLRAFAAMLVFFWHGLHQRGINVKEVPDNLVLSLFEEGWVGVTLFIVITGFLFTVLTYGKEIDYIKFLKNRFLRIIPLLFLIQLFSVTLKDARTDQLFLFLNLLGGGAVAGAWSLVVEFQFYVSYPFLRNYLVRDSFFNTVISCIALSVLFLMFRVHFYFAAFPADKVKPILDLSYWTIFGQVDGFLAGIVAGAAYIKIRERWADVPRLYFVAVFLGFVAALLFATHWFNERGGYYNQPGTPAAASIWLIWITVLAVLFAGLVLSYSCSMSQTGNRFTRGIDYLGTVSYSTYMLHFYTLPTLHQLYNNYLGFRLVDNNVLNEFIILTFFHYPITIAISALSYEIIEKSFCAKKSNYLIQRTP